jgi:glycosyltransferase involved in cell wall biosynthesis
MPTEKRIGFVSTRFAGTDGVSLESCKWASVLEENGYSCYWFAGELDRDPERSHLVAQAHFQHEDNQWINERIFGSSLRHPAVTREIHRLRSLLKRELHHFVRRFDIQLLIAENVLTIPMHVPLGLALTETVAETQIPTISHNHDFHWERLRYSVNAVNDYLRMAFPPNLPNLRHVVINSEARELLAHRAGISAVVVPNVLDFENPPEPDNRRTRCFRESIGLKPHERMILQPTRIVQRKGIEHAVELLHALGDPANKLVVSHPAGDEGMEYAEWLMDFAAEHGVDLRLVPAPVAGPWTSLSRCSRYSLWDVYPHADFITYPSLCEGFGNAFLEAIYFRKPMLINRYTTFVRDIEPLGFDLAVMDGFLNRHTVALVRELLSSRDRREQMVETNYSVARRHFSYATFRRQMNGLLAELLGDGEVPLLSPLPPKSQGTASCTETADAAGYRMQVSAV